MTHQGAPLIRLTGLYENKSRKDGSTYFSGVLGGAKVLLLKDNKAAEGAPQWTLFVTERAPKPAGTESNGA